MAQPTKPYATGQRRYLGAGRAPNLGATANKAGYRARDRELKVKREAQQRAYQNLYQRYRRS